MLSTFISQPDVALERCSLRQAQPQWSPHLLIPHFHRISGQTSFPSTDHTKGYLDPKVARAVWIHRLTFCFVLFCVVLEQHVVPLHQVLISAPGTPCCLQAMGWDIGYLWAAPQGFSPVLVPACCLRGSRKCLWWHPVHISFPGANYSYNSWSFNLIPVRRFDYPYPHACPANHALEMMNCKLLLPL